MADTLGVFEGLKLYEDGKHRRYTLWFAVNGGAFAVAKLLSGSTDKSPYVLGGLSLRALALGMIAFTAVMVYDIFKFGVRMAGTLEKYEDGKIFGPPGRIVLILLGVLLGVGWALIGFAPGLPQL